VLLAVWAVALVAALVQRRRRLCVVIALAPVAAVLTERLAKHAFGRLRDNALAYPSGHTTLTVVVLGVAVLTAGMATWAVVAATAVTVLAALGQAVTYHYFTDTVGAFFLGTALLATAGWALQLDRCQPDCDVRHSSG
jgi:hypothetical protein